GQDYEVVVNPGVGSKPIVGSAGNPAAETPTPFRAATIVDDPDLRSGWHWRVVSNKLAVGGSYTKGDLAGAFATASFSGGSVRWNTASGPDEGRARVLIDGTSRGVFDLSARTTSFVHRRCGGLGLGTHVIRIVVLGRHGVR